jgi:DNA-binding transcriptional regulator GbsR (MarR family)
MSEDLEAARHHFIQGMSHITHFWGFPKAMGAIYGAVYLSPEPISLDELVTQVGVSKGSVSTNIRTLERLGMVHKQLRLGDRKDYYVAESDLWKVVREVLKEREKSEFDRALRTVDESLAMLKPAQLRPAEAEISVFYQERMQAMKRFFNSLDNLVAMLTALEELRTGSMQSLFKRAKGSGSDQA